jgi:catechol 2,3-dioxygenase-like lactoylglutathione lyase family enzyme
VTSEDTRPLSHGQVCYLQLPAADRRRAAAFYETVFGWVTGEHYPDFTSPGLIGEWVEDRPPAPDGPTRILATIADPEGNPVGLAAHVPS